MNTNRRGKIAKLPRGIREELNRRLENGEKGKALAGWLNNLPEVQAMLAAEFAGEPINTPNLSHWTQGGGYRDWRAHQEALSKVDRIVEDAGQIAGSKAELLADRLSVWVMSRLILAADTLGHEGAEEKDWKLLRELSHDVAELRKGNRGAGWLELEKEKLADERKEQDRKLDEQFWKWAENPEIREAICRGFLTHGEKLALFRKAFMADVDEYVRTHPRRPIPGEAPERKPDEGNGETTKPA